MQIQSLVMVLTLALTSLIFSRFSAATENWEVQKDDDGIKVYSRKTNSGYEEIKATTIVEALPIDMLTLLDNVAIASKWIDSAEKVELINSPSENERIVHSYFQAPWPVKNRDMVTHSKTIFKQAGDVEIIVTDYSHVIPASNQYIRMENVRGVWSLKILAHGKMRVTYEGYGEPAGGLPVWLANRLVKSSTFNTFKQLRSQLENK